MGKPGYNTPEYKHHATLYRTGRYACWLHTGPWCTGIGDTVDHVPALSTFPASIPWRGEYRPACKPCQDRQGAEIRNTPTTTRIW
jgi:hypothetical protein